MKLSLKKRELKLIEIDRWKFRFVFQKISDLGKFGIVQVASEYLSGGKFGTRNVDGFSCKTNYDSFAKPNVPNVSNLT